MKLLREIYKTREGAEKRVRFERGLAKGEYERGFKAKHYHYRVVEQEDGTFRVERFVPTVFL